MRWLCWVLTLIICNIVGYVQAQETTINDVVARTHYLYNQIEYNEDINTWNEKEYWASPEEVLTALKGDCEDIAIAKYFSLIEKGILHSQLRLSYLLIPGNGSTENHLVLEYHENDIIYILDNRFERLYMRSPSYKKSKIMSFNVHNLWIDGIVIGKSRSIMSKWREVLIKHNKSESVVLLEGQLKARAKQ